ncbi:hypothetical protein GGR92_000884 [Spirosoma lacussanchae]|uniref:hypothetical protein n=1 Tax=Spirosoma lacussanchae TaxID=1884249 RepID=UPI00110964C1|nr:hypothetical protein [Spirosoma lacussanchae]
MNLRELLIYDFGVDFPIYGGNGNSIDNPIVIERTLINDYVGTEYAILKYLGIGRGIEWKTIGQQLLGHNDKLIDKIKIETKEITPTQIITQVENYYFDISECLNDLG